MQFKYSALHLLYYVIGGSLGALLRYFILQFSSIMYSKDEAELPFPHHTLAANVLACLLMGILSTVFDHRSPFASTTLQTVILIGFLGGLSTFSTFIADIFEHIRFKQYVYAYLYSTLSFVLSLGAGILGRLIMGGL